MHQPSPQWILHIGAHKTATTHIQDTLELRKTALAERGVEYLERDRLRRARLASCVRPGEGWVKGSRVVRSWRWAGKLAALRSDAAARTILISEEQFIGLSDGLLAPLLYPDAAERIGNLRKLLKGAPTTLVLSVRNPANAIPSAYSQCLRAGARGIPGLAEIRAQAVSHPPSWTHLVRRIRGAFPEARLLVWAFEDYIANPQPYLDMLSGTTLGDWPSLATPESTRSLSAETIERILALDPKLGRKERVARCAELSGSDQGVRRFQPFAKEEMAALTLAYEADLAELAREFPGVLQRLATC